VLVWPWRAAVVSSSPDRERNYNRFTDELTSVLAFHDQRALL
jgi:hypothetical protein